MIPGLGGMTAREVGEFAKEFKSGRLRFGSSGYTLGKYVGRDQGEACAAEMTRLKEKGWTEERLAEALAWVAEERALRVPLTDQVELVTTGPETKEIANRDTAVVVDDLFRHARRQVVIAGYKVYQADKVFETLARRMEEIPELEAHLFLHVERRPEEADMPEALVAQRFAARFRKEWPGSRVPRLYHYPPTLIPDENGKFAHLHAKLVSVDDEKVFISSANFSEAAQERNIEAGLLVHSREIAQRVAEHFLLLAQEGVFKGE